MTSRKRLLPAIGAHKTGSDGDTAHMYVQP